MSNHPPADIEYDESFKAFLSATNEKEVIASALADGIVRTGASILDIGAGNGVMTRHLLSQLSIGSYIAVEANSTFCDALTGGGISTIRGSYPDVDVILGDSRYDNVLSIYSAPLDHPKREKFLQRAFSRTNDADGSLTVVSFGGIDAWAKMVAEIETTLPVLPAGANIYRVIGEDYPEQLRNDCGMLGEVTTRLVTSEIITNSPEELYYAVAFTATAGLRKALQCYASSKRDIVNIIKRHAPSGVLTQSHTLVTIRRTEASND